MLVGPGDHQVDLGGITAGCVVVRMLWCQGVGCTASHGCHTVRVRSLNQVRMAFGAELHGNAHVATMAALITRQPLPANLPLHPLAFCPAPA